MLDQEFKYYLEHQDELVKKHNGLFVVIKNQEVLGAFKTEVEAILFAKNTLNLALGTFLVQQCLPGKESYTQFFHSHFIFT